MGQFSSVGMAMVVWTVKAKYYGQAFPEYGGTSKLKRERYTWGCEIPGIFIFMTMKNMSLCGAGKKRLAGIILKKIP